MEPFEYVMTLVSIVVGLGITHILAAMGDAVHRLRGHGPPLKLDATYLLWIGFVLMWLVLIWWSEYKLSVIGYEWTAGGYLQIIGYMISIFMMTVILVPGPGRMDHVVDSYLYFMDGRRWFFGALAVAGVLDFFDSMMKGPDWAFRLENLLSNTVLITVSCMIGWFSTRRWVQFSLAAVNFAVQVIYMFLAVNVLGGW